MNRRDPRLHAMTWLGLAIVVGLFVVFVSCEGKAQDGAVVGLRTRTSDAVPPGTEAANLGEPGTLQLAQTCFVEAERSDADCSAIYFVATTRAERAGITWQLALHRYSALRRNTPRANAARLYTLTDGPKGWAHTVELAARIVAGEVENPCPHASGWGGLKIQADRDNIVRNVQSGKWRIVKCARATFNTFTVESK